MSLGLRGAGPAGGLGQRLALQRALRAADLPDAGRGRASACWRTPSWPSRPASRAEGDLVLLAGDGARRPGRLRVPEAGAGRGGRTHPRARPGGRGAAAPVPGRGGRAAAAAKRARRGRRRAGGGAGRVARSPAASASRLPTATSPSRRAMGRAVVSVRDGRRGGAGERWPASCRCGRSDASAATPSCCPARRCRCAEAGRRSASGRCRRRWRAAADVRRVRHLRPVGAPDRDVARLDLLRPLRAPAPRPGERRHRCVRRRPGRRHEGHGPGQPGVRRAEAAGAGGPHGDRPRPLLDHRLHRAGATPSRSCDTPPAAPSRSATTATYEHRRAARRAARRPGAARSRPPTPR